MGHEINITKKLLAFLIKLADTSVCKVGQEFLSCLGIYYIRRATRYFSFGLFTWLKRTRAIVLSKAEVERGNWESGACT